MPELLLGTRNTDDVCIGRSYVLLLAVLRPCREKLALCSRSMFKFAEKMVDKRVSSTEAGALAAACI